MVKIRSVRSITVVAVLFSNKLVSFMSELSLYYVLESEFVERIGLVDGDFVLALKDFFVRNIVSKPIKENRLELVPN